jgi:hypothetical protein
VPGRYDFDAVAGFLERYSLFQFAGYEEPHIVIADARQRAKAIVRARKKKECRDSMVSGWERTA